MAVVTGKTGEISFASTVIEIEEFTFNEEIGEEDVSDSSSGDHSDFIPAGRISADASISGNVRAGMTMPVLGTTGACVLTSTTGETYSGTAFFKQRSVTSSPKGGGAVKFTAQIRFTGTVTNPTY
jgi:hypothetical protein